MKRTQTLAGFAGGLGPWTSDAFTSAKALLLGGNLPSKLEDLKIIPLRSSEIFYQIQDNDVWMYGALHTLN